MEKEQLDELLRVLFKREQELSESKAVFDVFQALFDDMDPEDLDVASHEFVDHWRFACSLFSRVMRILKMKEELIPGSFLLLDHKKLVSVITASGLRHYAEKEGLLP